SSGQQPPDVPVVKSLNAAVATCPLPNTLGCVASPLDVELAVTETSTYSYTLRGSPRTAPLMGTALGGVSIFVSGHLSEQSAQTSVTTAGSTYVGGGVTCNNNADLNATGGFYSPPPGTTTCGNGT